MQYVRLCFQKQIVQDQWPNARAVFEMLDLDGKGWIGVFDLEQLMEGTSASGKDLLQIVTLLGDEVITGEDFCRGMTNN